MRQVMRDPVGSAPWATDTKYRTIKTSRYCLRCGIQSVRKYEAGRTFICQDCKYCDPEWTRMVLGAPVSVGNPTPSPSVQGTLEMAPGGAA